MVDVNLTAPMLLARRVLPGMLERDYARIWRAADKVVFSRTLEEPTTARTGLEREFDPEAVHRAKCSQFQ